MAHSLTVKHPDGKADLTAQDPTNSGTATPVGATAFLIGPPVNGYPNYRGRYIREIAGTSGQFRHLRDEPTAAASPTTFSYVF